MGDFSLTVNHHVCVAAGARRGRVLDSHLFLEACTQLEELIILPPALTRVLARTPSWPPNLTHLTLDVKNDALPEAMVCVFAPPLVTVCVSEMLTHTPVSLSFSCNMLPT